MHIAILDGHPLNPGDLSWQPLEQFGTVSIYPRTNPSQTYQRAKDADIVITNKVQFGAQLLDQLPRLKCIVVTATGYNIIDLDAATAHGITVCNAPAYSTSSVAQHVFALLLHIVSHVAEYAREISILHRDGPASSRWAQCPDFCYISRPTSELAGKTMGIVGLGNIGQTVASIAHAIGLNVCAATSKLSSALPPYITKADLPTLLRHSDIVSLHCPLTPDTHSLIDAEKLSYIKHGAILINTARGPLVDEQAVAAALHSGRLSAFAADVLSTEPPAADNPLLHAPNAFITPHIAWATVEARQRLMDITVANVKAFLSGNPVNVVNL